MVGIGLQAPQLSLFTFIAWIIHHGFPALAQRDRLDFAHIVCQLHCDLSIVQTLLQVSAAKHDPSSFSKVPRAKPETFGQMDQAAVEVVAFDPRDIFTTAYMKSLT